MKNEKGNTIYFWKAPKIVLKVFPTTKKSPFSFSQPITS